MDLVKITPNKEKARNIVKMISLIEKRIDLQDRDTMVSLIIADYYEIIKELLTAILLLDGYKTLSHKDLIEYLKENYKDIGGDSISKLNDLRILRNRVSYDGVQVDLSFLDRNEKSFKQIINWLKDRIQKKLN